MSEMNGNCVQLLNGNHEPSPVRLRAATYLAPSFPVEYFELILDYLKSKLGYIDTSLLYESRLDNAEVAFDANDIDLAWISSALYLQLSKKGKVSLLPVSSVHMHPKGEDLPGYYSDVIIHKSLTERVKEFADLRGCKWAYNSFQSLSGNVMILNQLKHMGVNTSFFGDTMPSNNHLQSIHMVLNKQSDAAAVDSNCLQIFLNRNPSFCNEISVLTSWGPLPPYPLVVTKNMPQFLREEIVNALLKMHEHKVWALKLAKFTVFKFSKITGDEFSAANELLNNSMDMSFEDRYY